MKALTYFFALLLAFGLSACKGDKTDSAAEIDSTQMMENDQEETERFLKEGGDIIQDETVDTLPAPEDLPEESPEENLPPVEEQ